jgi:hypothetical protein
MAGRRHDFTKRQNSSSKAIGFFRNKRLLAKTTAARLVNAGGSLQRDTRNLGNLCGRLERGA